MAAAARAATARAEAAEARRAATAEVERMSLLETRGLTVTYGGLNANDDINLNVEAGKLIGLIGPNGAGKTTFIDAITGFTPPSSGVDHVRRRGDRRRSRPTSGPSRGLARTFQSLELFEDLTVRDNLLVAAERPTWYSFLTDIFRPSRHGRGARASRSTGRST